MKNLNIKTRCPKPFNTITIDKNGNCFACECSAWLPVPVGNIKIQELQDILESEKVNELRSSIVDGTYRYCNNQLCSYLLDSRPETQVWKNAIPMTKLRNLRLGIDDSCNLSCPSCRTSKIFEKRGTRLNSRIKMAKKIIDYLNVIDHQITVHLGSDGDPFASLVYRYFLRNCRRKDNIRFTIQTNGLLLEKMYHKNSWLFERCERIGLSVDGCSKGTYEKLRRGGSFKKLCKNLNFLKKIKSNHNFDIMFHCVVQKENYFEMPQYVDFAKSYAADRIWFNRIVDWKTYNDFKNQDIARTDHPLHGELLKTMKIVKELARKESKRIIEFPTLDIV